MIILLSIGFERSTDQIVDYFLFNKKEFIRINSDEIKDNKNFKYEYDLNNDIEKIILKGDSIDLTQKKVIWNRRYKRWTNIDKYLNPKEIDFNNSRLLSNFIFKEWDTFISFFLKKISKNTFWFDYPFFNKDKIDVLEVAKRNGLTIPKTRISNFFNSEINYDKYITKPLYNPTGFFFKKKHYTLYTTIVKKIVNNFTPSLFQEKIEKRYEIRCFYIDGEFYSMAIFSQTDDQTKLDFRNYNYEKPNRTIPYQLPKEIESCVDKTMKELNLRNGSIDFIRGIDGKYYFLEVNPVGQFGMTSRPCNYNLEKKIYEKLIEYETTF